MRYLLDTNALIQLFNGRQPLSTIVMKKVPAELAISGFTEAEIMFGVENSQPEKREANRAARSLGMAAFSRLYHDESISSAYGIIKAHLKQNKIYQPANEFDILIAATAIAKGLILVTENIKDFDQIRNLKIEDWSKADRK